MQQSAHRHIYAAGLEDIPFTKVASHPVTPSLSHTPQPSQSQCLVHSEEGEGEVFDSLSQHQLEEQPVASEVSLAEDTVQDTAETNLKIKQ